jgi:hypothetical protein
MEQDQAVVLLMEHSLSLAGDGDGAGPGGGPADGALSLSQAMVMEQDQMVQGHMARALGQMVEACRPALLSPVLLEETAAALKQVPAPHATGGCSQPRPRGPHRLPRRAFRAFMHAFHAFHVLMETAVFVQLASRDVSAGAWTVPAPRDPPVGCGR